MSMKNTENRWGAIAQLFHWLMFLVILGAWFAVESAHDLPKGDPGRGEWMGLHKSLGLTVFFLVWLRLAWRLANPTPKALATVAWQRTLATLTHWALYALMLLMPLSAMLASQYGGRPLAWFSIVEITPFLEANKPLAGQLMGLHKDVFWPLLLILVALHALAGIWHHVGTKDDTLKRMLPGSGRR